MTNRRSRSSSTSLSLQEQRLRWVQRGFILVFFVVVVRLVYWQVWKHEELLEVSARQYQSVSSEETPRGRILDRQGQVLAATQERYTLFAEPHRVQVTASEIASQLLPVLVRPELYPPQQATDSAFLALEEKTAREIIESAAAKTEKRWVPLWTRLSREQKSQIEALKIAGLGFDPHPERSYPNASVSAHLIGFVGKNEWGEDQGYCGVEGLYDRELKGRAGRTVQQKTALGLPIGFGSKETLSAQPGRDIILTLDAALQYRIEQELLAGIERYEADSGEIVVMDPHTGAVLAAAAFPNYDPQLFAQFEPKLYRNPMVSELYEPGSTLKVLTVAAGIESGVITPETQCSDCDGPRIISGFPIRTWNEQYTANVTMREALAKSDNTAMVFIQEQLGKERFLEWLRRFGLNGKTGVDLQGEASFEFRPDKDWRTIDVATASFGQGIATTSLGLVRAVATIANGGRLVQPYVVQAVVDGETRHETEPHLSEPLFSEATARTVTDMMVYTAQQGDSKWTAAKDVKVAGKTGTAQISENGKYLEDQTLTSFIGFAPADNPKFIMLVKLRYPKTSPWGSETAAPLWFKVAKMLL